MNRLHALPLLIVPLVCAVLGFIVTAQLVEWHSRVLLAALAAFFAFGIGLLCIGKAGKLGQGWLQTTYVWFAIIVAAGFVAQGVIGSETPWPAALGLTFGLCRMFAAATQDGTAWPQNVVLRGAKLSTFLEIFGKRRDFLRDGEPFYLWGGIPIPRRAAVRHFMVVGSVGSGKTTTIRMLMDQVLPEITEGSKQRAVIYDAKGDMPAILARMKLNCKVYNMNPYDQRGWGWKLWEDFTRPQHATQLAAMLYPESKGNEKPFYIDAPRTLISGFIQLFQEMAPDRWTLRDIICASWLEAEQMKTMFKLSRRLSRKLRVVLAAEEFPSIAVSVGVKLEKFEAIAAYWEYYREQKRELSIRDWPQQEAIILLPSNEDLRETLDPLNALFVRRLGDVVLAGPEDKTTRSWFFLDEFAELGHIKTMPNLVRRGRSKGVAAVIGFQELASLQDKETGYGENNTKSILAAVHTRAYLQNNDPDTAEWVSKTLMENEELITLKSWAANQRFDQANSGQHIEMMRRVLPVEISNMPVCTPKNGLHGWYSSTDYRQAWTLVSPSADWPREVPEEEVRAEGFHEYPEPKLMEIWRSSDMIRLKLPRTLVDDDGNGPLPPSEKGIFDLPDRDRA